MKKLATIVTFIFFNLTFSQNNTVLPTTNPSSGVQENAFIGYFAGKQSVSPLVVGSYNAYLGSYAGFENKGSANCFIGSNSGFQGNTGSGNVCLGYDSGIKNTAGLTISNQLFVDNSKTTTPLIWGDFANDLVKLNGKVGIGFVTTFPTTAGSIDVSYFKLFVKGGILTEEVRVTLASTWADYVFAKDYKLPTLQEVEKQIQEKGHLANMPSAKEVKENGIELGEMAKKQQEKIEELTLYIIAQNKTNEKQSQEIEDLKVLVKNLVEKNK